MKLELLFLALEFDKTLHVNYPKLCHIYTICPILNKDFHPPTHIFLTSCYCNELPAEKVNYSFHLQSLNRHENSDF